MILPNNRTVRINVHTDVLGVGGGEFKERPGSAVPVLIVRLNDNTNHWISYSLYAVVIDFGCGDNKNIDGKKC